MNSEYMKNIFSSAVTNKLFIFFLLSTRLCLFGPSNMWTWFSRCIINYLLNWSRTFLAKKAKKYVQKWSCNAVPITRDVCAQSTKVITTTAMYKKNMQSNNNKKLYRDKKRGKYLNGLFTVIPCCVVYSCFSSHTYCVLSYCATSYKGIKVHPLLYVVLFFHFMYLYKVENLFFLPRFIFLLFLHDFQRIFKGKMRFWFIRKRRLWS